LDGLERLGVVQLIFAAREERASEQDLHAFAALLAEIVVVKNAYGDLFRSVRRRQPMSLAAEVAWHLLPPLTFGTDRLVISCVLAPAYDVGGDCFDYSVGDRTAHFAIFDAMGHGLGAGWLATVAVAAYRNGRRAGRDFRATLESIDRAIRTEFGRGKFVTAVLAELDLASGQLRWHLAGHPAPLLIRSGRVVASLSSPPGLPLGLGGAREVFDTALEPGDRVLLFTDGVTEARSADGQFFDDARLADLVIRESAAGRPAPETLRRLMHALLRHRTGHRNDDATAMFVEWRGGGAQRITP
jgi:serine phosphatase RsbU (regulator of sigma subunit)